MASGRALDIASSDPRRLASWFMDKVAFNPPAPPSAVEPPGLIGGRLCYFFGRRVASYMYKIDGYLASLYVMPRDGLPVPSDTSRRLAGQPATVHARGGFTHVIWSDTRLVYSLVSNAPPERLRNVAKAMAAPRSGMSL